MSQNIKVYFFPPTKIWYYVLTSPNQGDHNLLRSKPDTLIIMREWERGSEVPAFLDNNHLQIRTSIRTQVLNRLVTLHITQPSCTVYLTMYRSLQKSRETSDSFADAIAFSRSQKSTPCPFPQVYNEAVKNRVRGKIARRK